MQLSINGKQLDVGAALRNISKASCLWCSISISKIRPTVTKPCPSRDTRCGKDVTVHVSKGVLLQGHAEARDAYTVFDQAVEHAGRRLRRFKRRLHNHHKDRPDNADVLPALQYVFEAENDAVETQTSLTNPSRLRSWIRKSKNYYLGGAVMRMDLANLPASLFRNVSHGGLNMVYRRSDGNIGWVDPLGERGGVAERS